MTTISTLTDPQIRKLIVLSASSISDNFFVRCNLVSTKTFNGIFQSIIGWISFYFIGEAIVLLLLMLPVIFFFHAQGKQKKMQQLYSKIRCLMLKFLVLITFALITTPLVSWAIGTKSPCIEGKSSNLVHFGFKYQCPSFNVVFAAVAAYFLFTTGTKSGRVEILNDNWKITLSLFFDAYLIKILSVLLAIFFFVSDIIYGKSSVIQGLFSIFFGLTISCVVEMLRIVDIIVVESVFAIALVICVIFNERPLVYPSQYNEFWKLCFYGIEFVIYSVILVVRFVMKSNDFKFKFKFSDFFDDDAPTSEFGEAYFGELEVSVENESDLYEILKSDLKDSAIATLIKVLLDLVSVIILEYLN